MFGWFLLLLFLWLLSLNERTQEKKELKIQNLQFSFRKQKSLKTHLFFGLAVLLAVGLQEGGETLECALAIEVNHAIRVLEEQSKNKKAR